MVVGAGPAGLQLRALQACAPGKVLRAWCRGIEVGRLALGDGIAADAVLEVPITRLPCVPLPASIRFAAAPDGPELAAPWTVTGPDVALTLLGPPASVLEDLRLDHGMLRGTGIERRNGLLRPVLHAIVNGTLARAVQVEAPVPLAEGGCAFRFALALEATDLTGSGLHIALHAPGLEAPLARFAWVPALPGQDGMAALEARLLRLEQAGETALAMLQANLNQRFAQQQERIDAFIDAAASLLLDRLIVPDDPASALRALIAAATSPEPVSTQAEVLGDQAVLAPQDTGFDLGWHGAEEDAGGNFRWMTLQGMLRNPAPLRPVAGVLVEIGHLYGAPAPCIEAGFDATPCLVAVEPLGAHHYRLRISPAGGPFPCRLLRLQALAGGSPAEDGVSGDDRVLSIAVTRVVFDYSA
jgi:hypothetical protein